MILKSYLVENNFDTLNQYNSIVFYGENNGLKDDFKDRLKILNKDADIFTIYQEDILKSNDIFLRNINNQSLFNTKKVIIINEVNDKILPLLQEVLEKISGSLKIFIFGNMLDKRSKIRNNFEKGKDLAIIPCYQDNERTLINYISKSFKDYKGLTGEIINEIIENSNLDRRIIKNEIIKIKELFIDKIINKEKLIDLLNIKLDTKFENIRDATIIGDKKRVNKLMGEMEFHESETFMYINQLYARFNRLIEIKQIESTTKDDELAMDSLKPKIFWKDKPIYTQQVKKWNLLKLKKTLDKISKTELLMKTNSAIKNDILIKYLLINICLMANSA